MDLGHVAGVYNDAVGSFSLNPIVAVGQFDLKRYNELQLQEIQRHKWIESEKAGRDLGQEAVLDWIHRYADSFRASHRRPKPSFRERLLRERVEEWLNSILHRLVWKP